MNQRGFTLVELLVTMAIFAILSSMAVLRINTTAQRDLTIACRELAADLRWMQQVAINTKAGDALPSLTMVPVAPTGYHISRSGSVIKKNQFPSSVQVNTFSAIQFNMNGIPVTVGTISLQSGGKVQKVIVDSAGRVRIE